MQKINRIVLKNYRQYKDVNISFKDPKGIYLFVARNGTGKSNFLNAICWCLYEVEPFKTSKDNYAILNESVSVKTPYATVEVTIEVENEDKTLIISRTWVDTQNSKLTIKSKSGNDWIIEPDPHVIIEKFLPNDLMNFFFFDGEAPQNLFTDNYSEKLKNNVWKVSNVELLDTGIDHLEKLNRDVISRISKDNPDIEALNERLKELTTQIESNKKQTKEHEEEISKASINLKKHTEKAGLIKQFKSETEKKELLQKNYEEKKITLNSIRDNLRDLTVESGILVFIKEPLLQMAMKIDETKKKGELPPKIATKYIEELINSCDSCICGRKIGKTEIDFLIKIKEASEKVDEKSFLQNIVYDINTYLKELNELPSTFITLKNEESKLTSDLENIGKQINEISEKLKNVDNVEMSNLENLIESFTDQIEKTGSEIARLNISLENLESEQKAKEQEIADLISTKEKNQEEKYKVEFLEQAIKKLTEIREKIIRRIKLIVSSNANTYFKQLIWKDSTFEDVVFEDDYTVTLMKKGYAKQNSLNKLSTGEKKVLGFATIKALTSISGFGEVPVFIDGPLEYLDEGVQEKFLDSLSEFLPDKQVFILSPDRSGIHTFVENNLNKDHYYEIILNQEDNCAYIRNSNDKS